MPWPRGCFTVEGNEMTIDESNMDTLYILDQGGNSLGMQRFEGKYYSKRYNPAVLKGIKTFELRKDDIYLCAFPRTGTHWVFEMISMLLNGTADTIAKFKGRHSMEVSSAESLDALPSPRLLNTHMRFSDGPEQLRDKECKIIYNVRDPKDVVVSLYNLYVDAPYYGYKGEFKDFLFLFLDGKVDSNGLFEHFCNAEKFFDDHPNHPVYIHIYEENIKEPVQEVQRLSDFIGLPRNNNLCQAIAEKCTFSKMKVDKDSYAVKYNGKSALYRKGFVGDWKNWFTDEMLEDYYHVYEEKMAGSRLYERYAK